MIEQINKTFVATWILVDDAEKRGAQGDRFARTLAKNWEFPLDLMFLDAEGRFVNKLNSFKHLRSAHKDVGHPPSGRGRDEPHVQVFLRHVQTHFGKKR
ncbi:MAG: hypothetical protein ACE5KM_18550 [Planctomycetaceae bacterium]